LRKTISVLGATGSIGVSTADLLAAAPERFAVRALIGNSKGAALAEQAKTLKAEIAVVASEAAYADLKAGLAGTKIEAACGEKAMLAAASLKVDWTMAAITGIAGLAPLLAAVKHGGAIALANKEAIVSAGDVMLRAVRDAGATLLPTDSEHNAIFQALAGSPRASLEKITLTASGGPFRTATLDEMRAATPEKALKHPVWSMGAKISIDSATLFNKGLEVIEAARLFSLKSEEIEVLVHPQSIIHGMVHFADGSILAQMGSPDMRIPIAHCLAWPERIKTHAPRLDLAAAQNLSFFPPDEIRFPALRLAREALTAGQGAPAVLNAANEIAVAAFLDHKIGFLDIAVTVERVMQQLGNPAADTLEKVYALDASARALASSFIARAA
jgi:1-deoxy-D-xylulose-5-phosphate reductoisomerase